MDPVSLITALQSVPALGPVLPWLPVAMAICAVLAAALPAPPAGASGLYLFVYRTVNLLGVNLGQAANANAPPTPKPLQQPPLALLLLCASLAACTPAGQAQVRAAVATPTGQLFCAVQAVGGPIVVALVTAELSAAAPAAAPVSILATGMAKSYVDAACASAGGIPVSPPANAAAAPRLAVPPPA